MSKDGLTASEQQKLQRGGVTTVEQFRDLKDDDFEREGIDIEERRRQADRKLAVQRDKEELAELMDSEGRSLSQSGRALIQDRIPNLRRLFALEKSAMKTMGMNIPDSTELQAILDSSSKSALRNARKKLAKLQTPLTARREEVIAPPSTKRNPP